MNSHSRQSRCASVLIVLIVTAACVPTADAQTNFVVSVASKTNAHPAFGQGWDEGYVIDGTQGAALTLQRGTTYTFQMQAVPSLHPFYISTSATGGGAGAYTNGVQGNFATGNQTLTFTPPEDAPDVLYYQCSTHANMGWTITLAGAVSAESDGELPVLLALDQNYPNPFNPSTVIRFHLAESARVALTIFDLQGREVTRLMDAHLPPGMHAAEWDGADSNGRMLPSGTYVYRISTSAESVERVMTLIR